MMDHELASSPDPEGAREETIRRVPLLRITRRGDRCGNPISGHRCRLRSGAVLALDGGDDGDESAGRRRRQ